MKAEYDFSKLKSRKNPSVSKLKIPVTMRLSGDVLVYPKGMAEEAGVPYQSLINFYLRDCLASSRKIQINWPRVQRFTIFAKLIGESPRVFGISLVATLKDLRSKDSI